jgi:hypothetical protein
MYFCNPTHDELCSLRWRRSNDEDFTLPDILKESLVTNRY